MSKLHSRGSSGSSSDEEKESLLPNGISGKSDQELRDGYVFDAVHGLNQIFLVIAITSILTLILIFVDEFTESVIPIWGIFLVVWIGHLALFAVMLSIVRLLLSSVLSKSERLQFSHRWHQANEKRIPLIQYVLYQLLWVLGASFLLFIFEILLYLSIVGIISFVSLLIYAYIIIAGFVTFAILCR